eukprot:TRINITY_DN85538_c0_g1_i1.p1 TRINITY_DN85538_c0_g1~~TRINITY_DN85538_c0_g1_i1.p1  ORF type:complete len:217 (-),score=15.58 TRINITY_DN85538_c0_g1_i1:168-818(-)
MYKSVDAQEQGCCLPNGVPPEELPLEKLPRLPVRSTAYFWEPVMGVSIVVILSGILIAVSYSMLGAGKESWIPKLSVALTVLCATVAWICTSRLVFGAAPDEICRSTRSSYPIPADAAEKIMAGEHQTSRNVSGPTGSQTLGTYCMRCCVWRPPSCSRKGIPHHCSTCQRCVTGFDHHCSLFGRCITNGNLFAFYLLVAMLPSGVFCALLPMALVD